MAPRLSLRLVANANRSLAHITSRSRSTNVCLFCSLTRPSRSRQKPASWTATTRRAESTATSPHEPAPSDARKDLQTALFDLQKHAPNYVNLSRIQLALRNLSQPPGEESIRVAVLGMTAGPTSGHTAAKGLLRAILADPLVPEQGWESQLQSYDATQPLVIRVGRDEEATHAPLTVARRDELLPEIGVSSPGLNEHNLEVLLMATNPIDSTTDKSIEAAEEGVLVPTVDIPSNTGRYTPISTPVHRALIVGDGILGAASLISSPILQEDSMVSAAINFKNSDIEDQAGYPFKIVDVSTALRSLALFRESVSNAREYEHLWFQSNIPAITTWLKSSLAPQEGTTKPPVRSLITSILRNTTASIEAEEARILSSSLATRTSSQSLAHLDTALNDWAQEAHSELQSGLDQAFTSRRWRALGWWKLFWRVDDISLLTSEMLSHRFLNEAERGVIYLTGRIREAGLVVENELEPTYPGPILAEAGSSLQTPTQELAGKWPTHIPYTRTYLLDTTIPALQALAQRLVVQSLSTSAAMSSLSALLFVSQWGGIYEAGSVAALGIVWSMRRLQKKWETARSYWEGEVREEGRKAVRATEASVGEVFEKAKVRQGVEGQGEMDEVRRVRGLVEVAEDALARLK
jgi:hypothetical protein